MKTITLIGMMGAGKTSISESLSKILNIKFVDIDSVIEQKEGCKISEIFAKYGEDYFRNVEKETIKSEFLSENCIISTGGGSFENLQTKEFLLENSTVIYLQASPEVIYNRIKNDKTRPLLCDNMSVEKISEILDKRKLNYESAPVKISTDNKTQQQVIDEIIEVINV